MSHSLPEPDESRPKPTSKDELEKHILTDAQIRNKLNTFRVCLFTISAIMGSVIVCVLVYLLYKTINTYLKILAPCQANSENFCHIPLMTILEASQTLPEDFWHIPLMLAFMSSTILSVILIQTAKFGALDNKAKDEQETSLNQNIPLLKELGDFIEKVKK